MVFNKPSVVSDYKLIYVYTELYSNIRNSL